VPKIFSTIPRRWNPPACPFLRAHEPNPAGRGSVSESLAGVMNEKLNPEAEWFVPGS
jgi:hypothetical protein